LLGSALWASWALPLYTPCVLRGALRFFLMKFLLTYQKKRNFKKSASFFLCFSIPILQVSEFFLGLNKKSVRVLYI